MVAHETLTEPRVTMEWLLAKPRSFSNLPVFLDLNGRFSVQFHFFRRKEINTDKSDDDFKQIEISSESDLNFFKEAAVISGLSD